MTTTQPLLTATEAAALVRADIKRMVKDGTLPAFPAGVTFGVRSGYASLMSEVIVTIKGAAREWAVIVTQVEPGYAPSRPTAACAALAESLMDVIKRHFTVDGNGRFATVRLDFGKEVLSA
jgi:hypothetical protein